MVASALIDTGALWKILLVSFGAEAGIVIAFGFVLLGSSRFAEAPQGSIAARAGYGLLAFLGALFCVAALVLGFVAMTKK